MIAFGVTDKGKKRKINEDYIYFSDEPIGALPNLYIVADGMGGHKAGEFASQFAVNNFIEFVNTTSLTEPRRIFKYGIKNVNELLYNIAQTNEEYNGMGTTFVVASIIGEKVYISNVGDSRVYIINDFINKITVDHSLVEEMIINGHITREESLTHPDRNVITRAVGVDNDVEVDHYEILINHHNDTILLCSDGLSNMVEEDDIKNIINSETDIELIVGKLVEQANKNGGNDNISVIIIN